MAEYINMRSVLASNPIDLIDLALRGGIIKGTLALTPTFTLTLAFALTFALALVLDLASL
jgi:hypothetical protein